MTKIANFASFVLIYPLLVWGQDTSSAASPVQMIVTVGHHYGQAPPELTKDDLIVTQRYNALPVNDLIPLRDERAGLELFFLVDNCSNCEPGSKFEELSHFISSQPPSTRIGVAYIRNGELQIAQNPTADRECAIQALSTPEGNRPASPFHALAGLIRSWPRTCALGKCRRIVVMISNGINPEADNKLPDHSAETALDTAQRAGVTVYAIYHPSADYAKTDPSMLYSGQVQLAHVADETGGEAYFLGFGPLPSLGPFLADLSDHLANQYVLYFMANPTEQAGELEKVTVKTKRDIEIMAPDRIFVPGIEPARDDRP